MNRIYDPIDLVLLVNGWNDGMPDRPNGLTIDDSHRLVAIAEALHRYYERHKLVEWWDGVYAYDVSEPLGDWIAESYGVNIPEPNDPKLLAQIRKLVIEASCLPKNKVEATLDEAAKT